MADKKTAAVASPAASAGTESAPDGATAEREKTIITEFVLKLRRHKDVEQVPGVLVQIESWAAKKGYIIDKTETSTPGYNSWTIHTPASLASAQAKANNVMREVRSLREDDQVKAEAAKLGITVDDLLKRTLAQVRANLNKSS